MQTLLSFLLLHCTFFSFFFFLVHFNSIEQQYLFKWVQNCAFTTSPGFGKLYFLFTVRNKFFQFPKYSFFSMMSISNGIQLRTLNQIKIPPILRLMHWTLHFSSCKQLELYYIDATSGNVHQGFQFFFNC